MGALFVAVCFTLCVVGNSAVLPFPGEIPKESCNTSEGHVCIPSACTIVQNRCAVNKNAYCISDRCGCEARFFLMSERQLCDISKICTSFNIVTQLLPFHQEHSDLQQLKDEENKYEISMRAGNTTVFSDPDFKFGNFHLSLSEGLDQLLKILAALPCNDSLSENVRKEARRNLALIDEARTIPTPSNVTHDTPTSGDEELDEEAFGRPTASENTGRGKKPNSKNKKSNQVSEQKATLGEPAKNATSPAKPELFRSHLKMMTKYFGDYSDIIVKLASLNMEILKQFTDVDGIFRQALQQSVPIDAQSFTSLAKSIQRK